MILAKYMYKKLKFETENEQIHNIVERLENTPPSSLLLTVVKAESSASLHSCTS